MLSASRDGHPAMMSGYATGGFCSNGPPIDQNWLDCT